MCNVLCRVRVFKCCSHPVVAPQVKAMRDELGLYRSAVQDIPDLEERKKTVRGKEIDTFCFRTSWCEQEP